MCIKHIIVFGLFSFDITKPNTLNDRRSLMTEWRFETKYFMKYKAFTFYFQVFNLRHYSVVNDLNPVFKIPYKLYLKYQRTLSNRDVYKQYIVSTYKCNYS